MIWNWVTIKKFAELSGYSEEAARQKIKKSHWQNRVHFKKAPDGRILINLVEVSKWIENSEG
jgi:hypothetical protein